MNGQSDSFVTYTRKHEVIISNGIVSIVEFLKNENENEKRSLLFCLDKYLDPFYEYNLSYHDDIIIHLEKQLFSNHSRAVKEDILQLIREYSKSNLNLLAEKIDEIEPELLEDALYTLSLDCNISYVPIFIRYENHEKQNVSKIAQDALNELKGINN